MLLELEGDPKWVEMAIRCMKLEGRDVMISTDGPMARPPRGFPRRTLASVGSNGSRNFHVNANKLLDWLLANGLVKMSQSGEVA